MSSLRPVQLYSLQVPSGNVMIEATEVPCAFRITMAALDPTAPAQLDDDGTEAPPRATLKLIREPADFDSEDDDYEDDDDYDDDDIAAIERRLGVGAEDDDDESSDDEEVNGGPSDPTKSKAARKAAAVQQLIDSLKEDEDMDDAPFTNGVKSEKGKQKVSDDDLEDEYDDSDDESLELEETVICTLDPTKTFQQPLDITINEDERIYFKVIGSHDIFLTGNYLVDEALEEDSDDEDDDEIDYESYLDDLEDEGESDEESDELDDLEDPRFKELDSDEEEVPALIKAADKKNNKKRAAESEDDEPAEPQVNGEKLSKKQQKKLKNNAGQAVAAAEQPKKDAKKETSASSLKTEKSDKKVQFAKNLEQGPTGSPKPQDSKAKNDKNDGGKETKKAALGAKVVNGVTIDDKKLGSGPAAKKGNRVGMRYIGKLAKDGKVFDSNKKGKPFSFKLGSGEVIKGWDIGIQGMQVGGERRISIPANLAYGSKGMPGIPGNSDLVFDVKMLELH